MKVRPILFSGSMVSAILKGRKIQTRRVIKPWPVAGFSMSEDELAKKISERECPYGVTGDRFWVRESWQALSEYDGVSTGALPLDARAHINYLADGNIWDACKRPSIHMPRWASRITLEITDVYVDKLQNINGYQAFAEGIDIESNRREREKCRKIREFDGMMSGPLYQKMTRQAFAWLWDELDQGCGYGWDINPWVWVISFKRISS